MEQLKKQFLATMRKFGPKGMAYKGYDIELSGFVTRELCAVVLVSWLTNVKISFLWVNLLQVEQAFRCREEVLDGGWRAPEGILN